MPQPITISVHHVTETGTPMHTQPNTPIDLPLIEIASAESY